MDFFLSRFIATKLLSENGMEPMTVLVCCSVTYIYTNPKGASL